MDDYIEIPFKVFSDLVYVRIYKHTIKEKYEEYCIDYGELSVKDFIDLFMLEIQRKVETDYMYVLRMTWSKIIPKEQLDKVNDVLKKIAEDKDEV